MSERRYTDEEVAEIFARASETEQATRRALPASEGMTLAQLQEIGREAGLAPELVAQAARTIDQPRPPAPPVFLGLPIGAARTVRLERRMTDDEWERLVVDLRETFNARGVVRIDGSLRSWSNGNLQALVEPDGDGQRVRFRTVKGTARPFMFMGLGMMGGALATFLAATFGGGVSPAEALASVGTLGGVGAVFFGYAALPLRSWARLRQRQMDELAERLTTMLPAKTSG
ncbi:MAG TPA: hypothetical protein VFZ73_20050 [Gemmatimonadaceae bacterium]